MLTDEDFIGCLAGNLRAAARVATRLYDARLAWSGLRIGQVALLAQLRRHGRLSTSQLAELLSIERSTAVRDVQVLERMGLVAGQPDATDRRSRQLSLTAQGEQRLAAAAPTWRSAQDLMRSRLGGQAMTELVTLAQRVVARSHAERPEAKGGRRPGNAMSEHRSRGATEETAWIEHYVELGGLRTWYGEQGAGDPLVALHPGLVDARAFGPALAVWSARFHTFTPERRGHGHTPDVDGPLTFAQMATDTIGFIETVVGRPTRLLGVSDGAIVALVTAVRRPDLVTRLVAIAGPAHHQGWLPEAIDPANEAPAFMHQAYGEVSPDGIGHYPVVLAKMAQTHLVEPTLTPADLKTIGCRTLVMVGDDDEVRLEHAVEMYRALPDGELAVVPGTSHGLLVEKPELCNQIILDFLEGEAVATLAPIRRR